MMHHIFRLSCTSPQPTAHRAIEEQSKPSTINLMLLNTILPPDFVSVYLLALKPDPVSYYAEKHASRHTSGMLHMRFALESFQQPSRAVNKKVST